MCFKERKSASILVQKHFPLSQECACFTCRLNVFFRRANQTDLFQMNITNYHVNYRPSFSLFHATLVHSSSANQLGSFFPTSGKIGGGGLRSFKVSSANCSPCRFSWFRCQDEQFTCVLAFKNSKSNQTDISRYDAFTRLTFARKFT